MTRLDVFRFGNWIRTVDGSLEAVVSFLRANCPRFDPKEPLLPGGRIEDEFIGKGMTDREVIALGKRRGYTFRKHEEI